MDWTKKKHHKVWEEIGGEGRGEGFDAKTAFGHHPLSDNW